MTLSADRDMTSGITMRIEIKMSMQLELGLLSDGLLGSHPTGHPRGQKVAAVSTEEVRKDNEIVLHPVDASVALALGFAVDRAGLLTGDSSISSDTSRWFSRPTSLTILSSLKLL